MYSLLAGCTEDSSTGISAVVSFYGLLSHQHGLLAREGGLDRNRKPREPLEAVRDLHCPLLALFGDEDVYVTQADVAELRARLDPDDARSDVISYSGAGHAFMNDTRPDAYRPEAARDAWRRMLEFLNANLESNGRSLDS
jgi:carboxymethylenebutenolidase